MSPLEELRQEIRDIPEIVLAMIQGDPEPEREVFEDFDDLLEPLSLDLQGMESFDPGEMEKEEMEDAIDAIGESGATEWLGPPPSPEPEDRQGDELSVSDDQPPATESVADFQDEWLDDNGATEWLGPPPSPEPEDRQGDDAMANDFAAGIAAEAFVASELPIVGDEDSDRSPDIIDRTTGPDSADELAPEERHFAEAIQDVADEEVFEIPDLERQEQADEEGAESGPDQEVLSSILDGVLEIRDMLRDSATGGQTQAGGEGPVEEPQTMRWNLIEGDGLHQVATSPVAWPSRSALQSDEVRGDE